MTPLEALEIIKHTTNLYMPIELNGYKEEIDIIETALKDYEELKKLKLLPYPKVNNKEYRKSVVKRLQALEIIKEKQIYAGMLIHDIEEHHTSYEEYLEQYDCYQQILIPMTEKEYDLLKEVLL